MSSVSQERAILEIGFSTQASTQVAEQPMIAPAFAMQPRRQVQHGRGTQRYFSKLGRQLPLLRVTPCFLRANGATMKYEWLAQISKGPFRPCWLLLGNTLYIHGNIRLWFRGQVWALTNCGAGLQGAFPFMRLNALSF